MDLASVVTLSDAAAPSVAFLQFLLPSLIGLGGSLLGGAMKDSAARNQASQQHEWDIEARDEQRAYDRGTFQRLVTDAEAAGFNPLTVLRNGGGAGYSGGGAPLSRQAPYQGGVGDALANWAGNFAANFDPMADDKREAEYALVNAQIANLNASTRAIGAQADNYELRRSGRAGVLSKGGAVPGSLASLPAETQDPQRTNPYPDWMHMEVNPWQPDMQNWEDHLGDNELASMAGSALMIGQDVVWNVPRFTRWAADKLLGAFKHSGGKPYRAGPDPYDRKMYIPPQTYKR